MKGEDTHDRSHRCDSQCDGKAVYHSPGEAANAVKRMKRGCRANKRLSGRVHPYRCNLCRKWHVGQMRRF